MASIDVIDGTTPPRSIAEIACCAKFDLWANSPCDIPFSSLAALRKFPKAAESNWLFPPYGFFLGIAQGLAGLLVLTADFH